MQQHAEQYAAKFQETEFLYKSIPHSCGPAGNMRKTNEGALFSTVVGPVISVEQTRSILSDALLGDLGCI